MPLRQWFKIQEMSRELDPTNDMRKKMWMYAPRKQPVTVPADVKRSVTTRAEEFTQAKLAPKRVQSFNPRVKKMQCVGFATKWYKNYFYLAQEFKDTRDNVIANEYALPFARLEYQGDDAFLCSYMRHTGEWLDISFGRPDSLKECFHRIESEPHFALI